VLDLPGPTPPDMRTLTFTRLTRPIFPLERELDKPDLTISTSSEASR
jgi:hypothetical protein